LRIAVFLGLLKFFWNKRRVKGKIGRYEKSCDSGAVVLLKAGYWLNEVLKMGVSTAILEQGLGG